MATAYQVQVPSTDSGLLGYTQNAASAAKVSELLQKDLESHHVFFNAEGFHNHIVHHLLTIYGTGGGPDALEKAYKENSSYQLKAKQPHSDAVTELQQDWSNASKYFGLGKHYSDFLNFFQSEIEKKGWQDVLLKYAFDGSEQSETLFARLFAGFLHPMIQLMYGIEWQQPALVASGLAQAAVHEDKLGPFMVKAEQAAKAKSRSKSLPELIEAVRSYDRLVKSAKWDDPNKIYDGVMARAPDEAIEYVSQVSVDPALLEERTVEMIHTAAYVATAAAFRPPHIPRLDFFLIHHLTSTPIFLSINKQDWIPTSTKVRLLEWKMRLDIIQYLARGSPPLDLESIAEYKPEDKSLVAKPEELIPRFYQQPDDGHAIKTVRGLLIAQSISKPYEDRPWIRIRGDDTWLRAHYMLLDSAVDGTRWLRGAGFEEAWQNVPTAQ